MSSASQTFSADPGLSAAVPAATGGDPASSSTAPSEAASSAAPPGWEELRGDSDIQFEPVEIPDIPPPEPGWFAKAFEALLQLLGQLFSPVGGAIASSWWFLQWVLLAGAVIFAVVLALRLYGPLRRRTRETASAAGDEPDWQPDTHESLALLEDADRLAREGRFDEATHLLLKRSVDQIARARPDWVEPSSTARELAALPALPDNARAAFRVVAERVERSLFALRSLDADDWKAAREAYATFALERFDSASRGQRT